MACATGGGMLPCQAVTFGDDENEEEWFHGGPGDSFFKDAFTMFEEIRSSGKLCDVTLVCDNVRFSAHRIVLAATTPYFCAMFTNDMMESSQREITMQGIEPSILEELVNFAYTRKVRITTSNVQALHIGAAFLQLQLLCDACSKFLESRLTVANVLKVRSYASLVGAESLINAADCYINKHFLSVTKMDDFKSLSLGELVSILSRDELYAPSEERVFEAVLDWVRHDSESRDCHISDLLCRVRLPLLKPQYLTDCVASEDLIKNSIVCRDLVDEAKDYHLMPERRPLLQSFRTKPRCCNDLPGIVYAVGGLTTSGDSLSTVEIYDPTSNRWSHIEPMATLRSRVGVAVIQRRLYAIGGFNGHERLKTVEVFDPDTKKWCEVAPLNNERSALGAAVLCDSLLYVCGGYDGMSSLASVEFYDAAANQWKLTTGMNKQRSAAGIAVFEGKIFVMGGHDGMSIFASVECFDPETGVWTMLKPMLNRRCRLGATTLDGKIYVCGGYDGSQFLRTVEVYDPLLDKWTTFASMNVRRSRVALVANCGKLFAIGGYDGISNLSSMEVLNPKDPQPAWTFGPSMIAHEGGVGIGVIQIVPEE